MAAGKEFGAYFRSRRKALGLSLREFCRRNGFDAGNVSRMERGLVPPPQSSQVLESYSKALKLDSDPGARDTFFELAASETGRIPEAILDDQLAARKLPRLLKQLQPRQRRSNWVTARELEAWADTLDARSTLPQLIRRLVRATGKDLTKVEFPAGEQVQRPGWDGVVEAGGQDVFVPMGASGWEFGVDRNPKSKADDDFAKRTKDPLGLSRTNTTFVFITPRKWQQKENWRQERTEAKTWKDVRVYDSASLEEWLEQAPAVDAWLAGILGIRPKGLTLLDEHWANLEELTDPSLKPEVFLASREEQVEELGKWLDAGTGALMIESRSPSEAIDFVVAFSRDPERIEPLASRALIVEDPDAWRTTASIVSGGLLLIAHPTLRLDPEWVADAVRRGHQVLLTSIAAQRDHVHTLKLPRAYRNELEQALVASGLEETKAERRAREAGGSVTVLKRLLARYPEATRPDWSQPSEVQGLAPLLLAGSWDSANVADQAALEKLSAKPYREVLAVAERWASEPDPPLRRAGTRWTLVSREDSWFLLASGVSDDALRRFGEIACQVLSEDDPTYELPPDERWLPPRGGEMPRYSSALRQGMAETLAIIGARPDPLLTEPSAHGLSERVVRAVLRGQQTLRWASLMHQLPLLAEASPESFLDAVEHGLKGSDSAILGLFAEDGDPHFARNPHAGLLWALERLAWGRDFFPRVSLILALLVEKAPEGSSGNRPSRCLREIFLPWFPQTTAPAEERIGVIRGMIRRHPDAGWRLLVDLIPDQHTISMPTERPSWRDWAFSWSPGATAREYWDQVAACTELLLEQLGDDIGRWNTAIEHFEHFPPNNQEAFLGQLAEFAETDLDDGSRQQIADTLRDKVATHRRFSDAAWALPEAILAQLDDIRGRFEPRDVTSKNVWLFAPTWEVEDALEGEKADLAARRRMALQDIIDRSGLAGVLQLVEAAKSPGEVGVTLAKFDEKKLQEQVLPGLLLVDGSNTRQFVYWYVRTLYGEKGWKWLKRLSTKGWSSQQTGQFYAHLPLERRIWDLVAEKGSDIEQAYWETVEPWYPHVEDKGELDGVVRTFLKHDKAMAAVQAISMALHETRDLEPNLLMDALQGLLNHLGAVQDDRPLGNTKHDIHRLFQALQSATEGHETTVDLGRLARLEWAYLGLLDGHPASPITLFKLLREEPDFFVQVLGLVFRSKKDLETGREPTENERNRARNAYRLFMNWKDVPGTVGPDKIDETKLLDWLGQARSLAKERGLLEVCDSQIGQVFGRSRSHEPDGSWPCIAVRDALEEIGAEDDEILSGFCVGIYNKRGVVRKSLREGGAQERAIAERYRKFAEACRVEWPKTATALRRVAEQYEDEARRADVEAQPD